MMKEMGYGEDYKYNPNYVNGRVKQEYLPEKLRGRKFLEDLDLGTETDPDLPVTEESEPPETLAATQAIENPINEDNETDAQTQYANDEENALVRRMDGEEQIWTEEEELAAMSSPG